MNIEYNKQNNIKEAIMEVIAFFDLFDYPLTELELWQYLSVKCCLFDIKNCLSLDILAADGILGADNGFYFLRGRKEIIKTKMARYNYADKKFKKAILVARFFKIIPWIRMIAVGNLIGQHNLKKQGDIDLFIITKKHRVWMTRFFCAGFARLFGLRPTEKNARDKICLSFFVSEDAMDLRGLMLSADKQTCSTAPIAIGDYGAVAGHPKSEIQNPAPVSGSGRGPKSDMDIYFIYWLACLVPIYNKDDIYNKFIKANSWIKNYLPNWQPTEASFRRDSGKGFADFYEDVIDLLIGGAEKTVKKIQLNKMPEKLKTAMNQDTRVVVNDNVLKLYANDRRKEYRKMWEKSLLDIKLKNWILQ